MRGTLIFHRFSMPASIHHLQDKKVSQCLKKFLRFFPEGFQDKTYLAWERNYKWQAHLQFQQHLAKSKYRNLLSEGRYEEICRHAVNIESKTNLLFSFEKMALRDAVRTFPGAKLFATGLFDLLYGKKEKQVRFEQFAEMLSQLPRRQTRVRTWPLQTVFGMIAEPTQFIFLKPRVTQVAANRYGFDFQYQSA